MKRGKGDNMYLQDKLNYDNGLFCAFLKLKIKVIYLIPVGQKEEPDAQIGYMHKLF